MPKINNLIAELERNRISYREEQSLAQFTTLRVGGNARLLVTADDFNALELSVRLAVADQVPFRVIGCGSNLIISDRGFDGLIILNRSKSWEIIGETKVSKPKRITSRYNPIDEELRAGEADVSSLPKKIVRVDSGFSNSALIEEMFKQGLTGLEWFSGIPSTVGGAVYMNMHGAHAYFGHLVHRAQLTDGVTTKIVDNAYFQFAYDFSILQQTKEIVLWIELLLDAGNVEQAGQKAKEWRLLKSRQPRRSAGCIFKNLAPEIQKKYNLPTSSIGYLIDKVLNLRGYRIGGAFISEKHAAFIENDGTAKADDVYQLVELIKVKAHDALGLELETEVEFVGKF